ncbi:MAG: hypothetical protein ACLGSH_01800 [Acidobacteriota bacterium]
MSITMDDIRRRQRMCSDKARFATEIEAKCFVMKKKAKLRAYQCPHCNDWHLTKRLTPPCATEGGMMTQTQYTPPPGRPQSTPPMPPETAPPLMNLEGAIEAYRNGRPTAQLQKDIGSPALKALYEVMEQRGIPLRRGRYKKAKPVDEVVELAPQQNEGVTHVPSPRPVRTEGESRGHYASRVLAWKRATDPEYDKQVHKNMRQGQLRRARIARVRKAFNSLPPVDPPKPLTLWQRIVRWFD